MPPKGSKAKAKPPSSAQSHPSIQSFYRKEVATSSFPAASSSPTKNGDGFTEQELQDDPLTRQWNPEREYDEVTIAELIPGPRAVTFGGRIVNLSTRMGSSPKQPKATGWHFLIVKDDLAAISVSPAAYFMAR